MCIAGQIEQLQRDILSDTCLRKELLEKLDSTKQSLSGEMSKLEKALQDEKNELENVITCSHVSDEEKEKLRILVLG